MRKWQTTPRIDQGMQRKGGSRKRPTMNDGALPLSSDEILTLLSPLPNIGFYQVKSRMQNQLDVPGQRPKYNFAIPSLVTVVAEEGLPAVYK